MKEVSVNSLTPQTYFNAPIYLDESYIILIPDIPITTELINRLRTWGYGTVLSDGMAVTSPEDRSSTEGQNAPAEITKSLEDEEQKTHAEAFFVEAVNRLEEAFAGFKARDELRIATFTDLSKEIMAELRENSRFLLSMEDAISPGKTYITTHSVKTAFLGLAIADHMKLPPFKQIDIGTSALLHEIGLLKIPESLYLTDRQLSQKERTALSAHPVLGFRILKTASFPIAVCQAVLDHNERIDGTGLPRRVAGEKISVYGKILAVASSYNAAVSKRPYRPGIDGHSGLMDLLKDAGKRYDEKALSALLYTLSLYPIGTYIVMFNGSIGLVVKADPQDPRHPVIKLLIDENGNHYADQPVVRTRKGDDVSILRSISKVELQKLVDGA